MTDTTPQVDEKDFAPPIEGLVERATAFLAQYRGRTSPPFAQLLADFALAELRKPSGETGELVEQMDAIQRDVDAFNPDMRLAARSVFEAQEKFWKLFSPIRAALARLAAENERGPVEDAVRRIGRRIDSGDCAGGLTAPVNGTRYWIVNQETLEARNASLSARVEETIRIVLDEMREDTTIDTDDWQKMLASLLTDTPAKQPEPCEHLHVNEGPRIPLRYGSAATEVCTDCGSWRDARPPLGPWQEPGELARRFIDAEEAKPRTDTPAKQEGAEG